MEAVGRARPSRIMEATFSLVSLVGSAVSKTNFQGFFLFILAKGMFYSGQKIINGGLFFWLNYFGSLQIFVKIIIMSSNIFYPANKVRKAVRMVETDTAGEDAAEQEGSQVGNHGDGDSHGDGNSDGDGDEELHKM